MYVGLYLQMVKTTEQELEKALKAVADRHQQEPDLEEICTILSSWSQAKARSTDRFIHKYGRERDREPQRLYSDLFQGPRRGGLALLRDLHDLWLMTTEAQIVWTLLAQAAQALRDKDFVQTCEHNKEQTHRQTSWLETRSKQAAPQTLIAA
ncbi:MAG TPA: hypothetical protein VJR69_09950 [Nitrospira sp.]|nr:hypothetical protein [Nitrospira sp.]